MRNTFQTLSHCIIIKQLWEVGIIFPILHLRKLIHTGVEVICPEGHITTVWDVSLSLWLSGLNLWSYNGLFLKYGMILPRAGKKNICLDYDLLIWFLQTTWHLWHCRDIDSSWQAVSKKRASSKNDNNNININSHLYVFQVYKVLSPQQPCEVGSESIIVPISYMRKETLRKIKDFACDHTDKNYFRPLDSRTSASLYHIALQ